MIKLTDANMQTYNNTQWKIGEKKIVKGEGKLGSAGWLHCYPDLTTAITLNHLHADFNVNTMRAFEILAEGKMLFDGNTRLGASEMTFIKEISLKGIILDQPTLLKLTEHSNWRVRHAAAERITDQPTLLKLTEHLDWRVRRAAAERIKNLK